MSLDRMVAQKARQEAMAVAASQLGHFGSEPLPNFLTAMMGSENGKFNGVDFNDMIGHMERGSIAKSNALAALLRKDSRRRSFPTRRDLEASGSPLAKSSLDVGFQTNLASVTGGQTVGVISLDTKLARGTIRPSSFTLYNHLNKTRATQVVDYWPYAEATGGAPIGAAYQSFTSQTNTVPTNVGKYNLNYLTLKMAVDGRAMTLALAQQGSFVNLAEQETANAALTILGSVDWALYWGNPTLYPYQPVGFAQQIPAANIANFQTYFNTVGTQQGLTTQQALFNLIYELSAQISGFGTFGQITHAFMTPVVSGDLQQLVTQQLRMLVNNFASDAMPLMVNGDLQGINTRFGPIQFPLDMLISARDTPLAATIYADGTTPATTSGPTPPASVTAAVASTAQAGSAFTAAYAGNYKYAVVSANASMFESTPVLVAANAMIATGSATLTITPPVAADATAFRVFRSGLGYTGTDPSKFRWIGDVAANGASAVTFTDLNTHIPGSETIFLFDMDENDSAIDYRYLLPLTKIDLFTSALFMPWAVAHIGAPRMTVPKFHAMITGYVPVNTKFNPLAPNT